jgi:hypothetical protein
MERRRQNAQPYTKHIHGVHFTRNVGNNAHHLPGSIKYLGRSGTHCVEKISTEETKKNRIDFSPFETFPGPINVAS